MAAANFAVELGAGAAARVRCDRIGLLVAVVAGDALVLAGLLRRRRLQLARQRVRLALVQHQQAGEPPVEEQVLRQVVGVRGALQQLYLRQHLELLPLLVEVDERAGANRVGNSRVDHRQVGQECSEIGDRAVAYVRVLKCHIGRLALLSFGRKRRGAQTHLLLENFLQMPIILAGCVGELGCALAHQHFTLGPRIVVFGEYSRQFVVNFQLKIIQTFTSFSSRCLRASLPFRAAAPATSSTSDK